MKEIAKLILRMYEKTKSMIAYPEGFDDLNDEFFGGLSEKQKDMFLKLETMHLEISETRQIDLLEFVLNASVEE